ENIGPYFACEVGVRSTGYNPSALPDFHAWLKGRYKDISDLNRQWKATYARFEDIQPPQDLCLAGEWKRPHPLGYEFQSWREDRHVAWLKLIYDAFKKADPAKPVLADHSGVLRSVDGSRLFDTCDILSVHMRSPHFMLASIYTYSMNRFARKQLGQYECFWGCQEDLPRIAEEKAQRCAMMKYLYRLTIWGRHLQIWWYAYTSADYLLSYNGNWFNPVYDLTTLRYCAAALPVGKAKVKRLEDVFLNSSIAPSRVVMIQPNTSMLYQRYAQGESFLEMLELHELLFARNDLYELIPETYFGDGRAKLDDFDVVILPYALYLPDRLSEQLRGWVEKGGLLIATGPFGLYDKSGFDKRDLWAAAFGSDVPTRLTDAKQTDWQWSVEGKSGDLLEAPLGKGKVMATLRSLRNRDFKDKAASRLVEALEAKARRAARCASNDFEMTVHEARGGARYLCVLNRNVDKAVADTVTLSGEFKRGLDLDAPGGFPLAFKAANGETSFTLCLEPAEFTLIALEK
ncbi:MAG: hypothetical protein FJ278_16310, partial [Planctomycetes bacterium]|nr:hypothetical protein [Planctomycetota bacterium]